MSDVAAGNAEVPENAQDLTIFVQNLLEQMVREIMPFSAFAPTDVSDHNLLIATTLQPNVNIHHWSY